jgi:hypothetical protein
MVPNVPSQRQAPRALVLVSGLDSDAHLDGIEAWIPSNHDFRDATGAGLGYDRVSGIFHSAASCFAVRRSPGRGWTTDSGAGVCISNNRVTASPMSLTSSSRLSPPMLISLTFDSTHYSPKGSAHLECRDSWLGSVRDARREQPPRPCRPGGLEFSLMRFLLARSPAGTCMSKASATRRAEFRPQDFSQSRPGITPGICDASGMDNAKR